MASERTSQSPLPEGSGVAVFRTVEVGPSDPSVPLPAADPATAVPVSDPAIRTDPLAAVEAAEPPASGGKRSRGKGLRPVVSSSSVPLDRAETEGYRSSNRVDSARVVLDGAVALIKSSPHFDPPKASVVLKAAAHEPVDARMTLPGLRRSPLAAGKPWMLVGAAGVALAVGVGMGGALMMASAPREAASAARGDAVPAAEQEDERDSSPPVNAAEVVGQAGIRANEGATLDAVALPEGRAGKGRAAAAAQAAATAPVNGRAILADEPTGNSPPQAVRPAPATVDLSETVPVAQVVLEEEPEAAPAATGPKRGLVRDAPF